MRSVLLPGNSSVSAVTRTSRSPDTARCSWRTALVEERDRVLRAIEPVTGKSTPNLAWSHRERSASTVPTITGRAHQPIPGSTRQDAPVEREVLAWGPVAE
jgi:hypothetical protein